MAKGICGRMKRIDEIKAFAKAYCKQGMTLDIAKALFAKYSNKPVGYRKLVEFDTNPKTSKGQKYGYLTGVLYLAPANIGGIQVCFNATEKCIELCLTDSGMGKFDNTKQARLAKKMFMAQFPEEFMASLIHDAFRLMRAAAKRKLKPAIRPNGTSDVPKWGMLLADTFPMLTVYDYTKNPKPWLRTRPNYDVTFSYSEKNLADCLEALERGFNVAKVSIRRTSPRPGGDTR